MRSTPSSKQHQAGFAISAELLLIAVVVLCGLVTGWAKFRDQSGAEIKDAVNAIDAFTAGVTPMLQPYAQQWITGAGVVGCSPFGAQPTPPDTCGAPVSETYDPEGKHGAPFSPSTGPFAPGEGPTELVYSAELPGAENSKIF